MKVKDNPGAVRNLFCSVWSARVQLYELMNTTTAVSIYQINDLCEQTDDVCRDCLIIFRSNKLIICSVKCPSSSSRVQDDVSRCLVLSDRTENWGTNRYFHWRNCNDIILFSSDVKLSLKWIKTNIKQIRHEEERICDGWRFITSTGDYRYLKIRAELSQSTETF